MTTADENLSAGSDSKETNSSTRTDHQELKSQLRFPGDFL